MLYAAHLLSSAADDLLSIFSYILIKSRLPHVISEACFIQDFVSDSLKHAMPGYFLATLQAAIELIQSLDKDEIMAKLQPATQASLERYIREYYFMPDGVSETSSRRTSRASVASNSERHTRD